MMGSWDTNVKRQTAHTPKLKAGFKLVSILENSMALEAI